MNKGFTLIETLIAIAIFAIVGTAIYFSYSNVLDIVVKSKLRSAMIAVMESEIEIVRNIPYPDVGVQGGAPSGNLKSQKIILYEGIEFNVNTTVRNVDDPFDGLVGGSPSDLIPGDYKLVEIEVSCVTSCLVSPIKATTTTAPKNLERATKDGSLFISVFDASGQPVSGANVSVVNSLINPPININDTTNVSGSLDFVQIATSSAGYRITVTKSGYTQDRTYPPGDSANPNPLNPDATVNEEDITNVSFSIDNVSTLNFKTQDQMCKPLAGIDFKQIGTKLIGISPDIPKYSVSHQTDVNGQKIVSNLEWDAYTFTNLESDYEIAGTVPISPFVIVPASTSTVIWVMESKTPSALLVNVVDEDDNPVNDAVVQLTGIGFDETKYTARRKFGQSDWSSSQYNSKTSYIDTEGVSGQITLNQIDGKYATSSEELISKIFDLGTSNTTFYTFSWSPLSQPAQTGTDSLKFQFATNNDDLTWNFVGPNGNANTYYTTSNTQLHSSHNGKRYLRYKVFMKTENDQFTPKLEDLKIEYNSSCVSSGQAYFNNLANQTYSISVSKSGFDTFVDDAVLVDSNWQEYEAVMSEP